MEMSTTKFKSLHGNKRLLNSEGGVAANIETSRSNLNTVAEAKDKNQPPSLEKKKEKKPSNKSSYESAYVDVSEDKMREFAMS